MLTDPWLQRWLPLIAARAGTAPILEIGCGHGDDTVTLTKAGHDVVAFDLSSTSVAAARLRAPSARIECQDIRDPFPALNTAPGVVVASLSLHYFPWAVTVAIVQRIHALLAPGGLLLCRLNATDDHHFGAGEGVQVEENYYAVGDHHKRFFDQPTIERLFSDGWRIQAIEHMTTRKYLRRKALWEIILEKVAD